MKPAHETCKPRGDWRGFQRLIGPVSFQPAGTDDWVTAGRNRPVTTGDKLWSDNDGRVELQHDGSLIRLSNNTGFSFLNLSNNVTQIQLTAGTLLVRVRRLDDTETYDCVCPLLAQSIVLTPRALDHDLTGSVPPGVVGASNTARASASDI